MNQLRRNFSKVFLLFALSILSNVHAMMEQEESSSSSLNPITFERVTFINTTDSQVSMRLNYNCRYHAVELEEAFGPVVFKEFVCDNSTMGDRNSSGPFMVDSSVTEQMFELKPSESRTFSVGNFKGINIGDMEHQMADIYAYVGPLGREKRVDSDYPTNGPDVTYKLTIENNRFKLRRM